VGGEGRGADRGVDRGGMDLAAPGWLRLSARRRTSVRVARRRSPVARAVPASRRRRVRPRRPRAHRVPRALSTSHSLSFVTVVSRDHRPGAP
jgi:hypothetical protein